LISFGLAHEHIDLLRWNVDGEVVREAAGAYFGAAKEGLILEAAQKAGGDVFGHPGERRRGHVREAGEKARVHGK
jgi:hypothetical protein